MSPASKQLSHRYAILGYPVAHSLSPAMQNAAFRSAGIQATYEPIETPPNQLVDIFQGLAEAGFVGFNVTVPHKESIMALLDDVSDEARKIGAVNTVQRTAEGKWYGTNTDAPGFIKSLLSNNISVADATALVLGAGGAARAIAFGLAETGARSITIAARRSEQAEALVEALVRAGATTRIFSVAFPVDVRVLPMSLDLIIQTTPVTMQKSMEGEAQSRAFAQAIPWDRVAEHGTVTDIVYRPLETSVLKEARQRGFRTIDGLDMLLYQGALAFEAWTGIDAPIEVMRNALRDAFGRSA